MLELEDAETMVDLLRVRADRHADRCGYAFCSDDGARTTLGVSELARRAQAIAAELQQFSRPGDRALLVYPAGLEFLAGFFGCLYAGVLPVPATYPRPRRPLPRLAAISADCGATLAMTTARTLETLALARSAPELRTLRWIASDDVADEAASRWRDPRPSPDDLAFLQYTSGSTSRPKGVMVSHRNLIHNLQMLHEGFDIRGIHADGVRPMGVCWLPAYHDMGLIGSLLTTLYGGFRTTLMSPTAFLQRPLGWLQLIASERATITGAPNFAYEMCVARTTPAERATLDLSSVRLTACGAEPIRADTLARFAQAFADCGFRAEAFYPCYGLAESTLLVAGGRGPAAPITKTVCRASLGEQRIRQTQGDQADSRTLVACGRSLGGQEIAIVDPLQRRPLPADQVGEIWIRGASVAQGYWQRADDTRDVFQAQIADGDGSTYLRTGDLGFVSDDQLYVTGRLKDLIIIRGRNHYPQDIERTVGQAHPVLHTDRIAAVSVDADDEERLVVVAEVDRAHQAAEFDDVFRAVRRAVAGEHELAVEAIVLIRQASLPRTTSGKLQRSLCRQRYLQNELKVVAAWSSSSAGGANAAAAGLPSQRPSVPVSAGEGAVTPRIAPGAAPLSLEERNRLTDRIETRLVQWIVQRCDLAPGEVDRHKPFAELGLDSLSAVELSAELEQWLQVQIPAVAAWNHPTPHAMARYLAQLAADASAAPGESLTDPSLPPDSPSAQEFEDLLADIEGLSEADVEEALKSSGFGEGSAERQAPG